MNNVECESCVKRRTMYCPNSFKCYATKDKPYWQNRTMLLEENKELHNKIDKAIEELDRVITFCENDSQGGYDICNMAVRNYKNIRCLLKGSGVDE